MFYKHIVKAVLLSSFLGAAPTVSAIGPVKNVSLNEEYLARLTPADQARATAVKDRLEAIMAMDRSAMDRAEKRAMREEVRVLKGEAEALNERADGSVIYISTAGLIIIILLLIILL